MWRGHCFKTLDFVTPAKSMSGGAKIADESQEWAKQQGSRRPLPELLQREVESRSGGTSTPQASKNKSTAKTCRRLSRGERWRKTRDNPRDGAMQI